jgi:hypothetical protein
MFGGLGASSGLAGIAQQTWTTANTNAFYNIVYHQQQAIPLPKTDEKKLEEFEWLRTRVKEIEWR